MTPDRPNSDPTKNLQQPPNQPVSATTPSFSELALQLVEQSRKEITYVRWAYSIVSALVAVLIAIGIYFTASSLHDFKTEFRDDAQQFRTQLKEQLAQQQTTLDLHLSDQVTKVSQQVSNRIDQAFQDKQITLLVQQKAQERIDAIADSLIHEQVSKMIAPLKQELTDLVNKSSGEFNTSLGHLDERIKASQADEQTTRQIIGDAQQALANVQAQTDFVRTFLAALFDKRDAFDRLVKWSTDLTSPFQSLSSDAVIDIKSSFWGQQGDKPYLQFDLPKDADPHSQTLDQLKTTWQTLPSAFAKFFVMNTWDNTVLTKDQKFTFLHDIIADSHNSLMAADKAARYISDDQHLTYDRNPLDFNIIDTWYKNRSQTNLPPQPVSK
jgi:hypothetical protein